MIFTDLAHAHRYFGLSPRFDAALKYMMETDFSQVEDGHYELDGDNLFVNVMTFETKGSNPTPEHHKLYADIQFVLEGREVISVAPLDTMGKLVSQNGDCYLFEGVGQPITVPAGSFVIVWPEDAHAPGVSPTGKPEKVRKAVVKVRLEEQA